ncbi:hypothetical protein ACFC1R_27660 [Kitasatospora sp. NPDC056138]|uniref:hypothetical protein n=1 Tax=Kitasatospora sp. NPDC056138 TaxID=3345724 RepID=UPI0035E29397
MTSETRENAAASAERPHARTALEADAPGGRLRWSVPATQAAAVGYAALQTWWSLGHAPSFGRFGTDLLVVPHWGVAVLCLAAAALAHGLRTAAGPNRGLLGASWAVSGVLLVSCPLLLLDVVGALIPGLRIPHNLPGALSRAACFAVAALLFSCAAAYRRSRWGGCPCCSRTGEPLSAEPTRPPRWAWWAAYGAVASCWLRIVAQYGLGWGSPGHLDPAEEVSLAVFEAGFVMAGTLLPLSLVHGWGRVFPRWVPLLARRRVPRRLLLPPAAGLSVGLLVYFGVGIGQLVGETIRPRPHPGSLPLSFLWVAMPAYWLWGLGLGVAAVSYHRRTRRPCRVCGR